MSVKFLGINHDGPVVATDLRHDVHTGKVNGVFGTFQPEDFDKLVDYMNRHGGPTFWEVEAI